MKSGLFRSLDEIINEALQLLEDQDDLRRMVQVAIRGDERGEFTEYASGAELATDIKHILPRHQWEAPDYQRIALLRIEFVRGHRRRGRVRARKLTNA